MRKLIVIMIATVMYAAQAPAQSSFGELYVRNNLTFTTSNSHSIRFTRPTTGIGTVAITNGGSTVTGTGTKFTEWFTAGLDNIIVSGQSTKNISSITSDTVLTVVGTFSATGSGLTYTMPALTANSYAILPNGLFRMMHDRAGIWFREPTSGDANLSKLIVTTEDAINRLIIRQNGIMSITPPDGTGAALTINRPNSGGQTTGLSVSTTPASGAYSEAAISVTTTDGPAALFSSTNASPAFPTVVIREGVDHAADSMLLGFRNSVGAIVAKVDSEGDATFNSVNVSGGGSLPIEGSIGLTDTDVAHGMTTILQTDAYGLLDNISETAGGLMVVGASDTDSAGVWVRGYMGSTDPTDTSAAVLFTAGKKNGASAQALGASETAFQFKNVNTEIMTMLGDGRVGVLGSPDSGTAFQVNGTSNAVSKIKAASADSNATFQMSNDAQTFQWYIDGAASDAYKLRDSTASADRFTMSTGGAATFAGSVAIGAGTAITKHLSATASIDYAQASANTCETLTITVTGAADGNNTTVGVPHALANHNTTATMFSWVSATNTVSVRRCVITADGSNPAAATVRADVWQH